MDCLRVKNLEQQYLFICSGYIEVLMTQMFNSLYSQ